MNNHQVKPTQLWAWALTGKDVDKELEMGIEHYRRRFGKRPFLVYCPEGTKPKPVEGLEIESHGFGSGVLYFAIKEKVA
jgi:hypothetical protein